MKYHPDAYEMQEVSELCRIIKAKTLKGAEMQMVYCQMLDEDGKLTDWKQTGRGNFEQIKDDSPPKEHQSDFSKTVMRIHTNGKPIYREV